MEMSKRFSKIELKHLKWMMITQRGMTSKQADEEIERMINEDKKSHARAIANKHQEHESRGILAPLLQIPNTTGDS